MLRTSVLRVAQHPRRQCQILRPHGSGRNIVDINNSAPLHFFHFDRLHKFDPDQPLHHAPLQSTLSLRPSYKNVDDLRDDLRIVFCSLVPLKTLEREIKKHLAARSESPRDETEKFRRDIQERLVRRLFNRCYLDMHNRIQDLWETMKLPSERIKDRLDSPLKEEKWNFRDYKDAVYTFLDRFVQRDPTFDPVKGDPDGPQPLGYKWTLDTTIKERDLLKLEEIKLKQGCSPEDVKKYLDEVRQLKHWSEARDMIALRVTKKYQINAAYVVQIFQRCIVISFRHRKIFLSEIFDTVSLSRDPSNIADSLEQADKKFKDDIAKLMEKGFTREEAIKIIDDALFSEPTSWTEFIRENERPEDIYYRMLSQEEKDDEDIVPLESLLSTEDSTAAKEEWMRFQETLKKDTKDPLSPQLLKVMTRLEEMFNEEEKLRYKFRSWDDVPKYYLTEDFGLPESDLDNIEKFFTAKDPLPLPPVTNGDPNSITDEQLDEHIAKHGLDKLFPWDQLFSKQLQALPRLLRDTEAKLTQKKVYRSFRRFLSKKRKQEQSLQQTTSYPQHRCKMFHIPSDFLEAMKRVPWPADQSLLIESFYEHLAHKGNLVARKSPPILGEMEED
jgi:hypothetical protein